MTYRVTGHTLFFKFVFSLLFCISMTTSALASTLFQNSIVANDIDFIKSDDPTVASTFEYEGIFRQEMPDRRSEELFDNRAYKFLLNFSDGSVLEVYCHSDFNSLAHARKYVGLLAGPLGKLPLLMRGRLSHVVIHMGDETAFSEQLGHFFVLYSKNMETRINNNDLEETVFHETVHAVLDYKHTETEKWKAAQRVDNQFVTDYGTRNPIGEDFAETAIFAYTLLMYPGRLPISMELWLHRYIPGRLAYFSELFNQLDE